MTAARSGASAVESRPAPAGDPARPAPGRAPSARDSWLAAGLFLLAQALLMAAVRVWQPRFFTIDDKLAQYLPVWYWLGSQPGFRPPVMDADQGSGGNFVGDLQYGVLDPFHWALAEVISRMDGLNTAGWGLHVLAVSVLGLGVVAVARHLGVGPVWAAAAALGAANSGFLLWFGASWWPAAWGTAVLPWLWWGMVTRSRWGVPVAALAAYLVGTSGYPYSLPFAGLVVAGVGLEAVLQHRAVGALLDRRYLCRVVAAAGGLLMAAPGLLATSAMAPYSQRATLEAGPLGSTGDFIPNLLDVLVGGPTATPQVTGWWGTMLPTAVTATAWYVLPVLALVPWRRLRVLGGLRAFPGLVVSVLLAGVAVLATQTPTVVASLRFPFRYVVVLELVLPLLVALLAARVGLRFTRGRLAVASGLLLLQGLLGTARTPGLAVWHLGVAVLGVLVLVGLARAAGSPDLPPETPADGTASAGRAGARSAGRLVAVGVLVVTGLAPLASIGSAVAVNVEFAADRGDEPSGLPASGVNNAEVWPVDVASFRERSVEPGLNATVLVWGDSGADRGLDSGVPAGSAALFSGVRPGFGYTSVGQAGWADRWCQDYLGQSATCVDAVARLLETVPGTGRTWLDVSSKDVLLVDRRSPPEIGQSLAGSWREVGVQGDFVRYERIEPTPGRITYAGDAVTSLTEVSGGPDRGTYEVAWTAEGDHRLITRIPWWPGYRVTLDGEPLDVRAVDGTLVAVDLPQGAGSGELRLSFRPPGLTAGLAAAAVGLVLVGVALVVDLRRHRATR